MLIRTKILAALIAPALLFAGLLAAPVTPAQPQDKEVTPSDTEGYYKAKCFACHGAKAEKKFNVEMPEEQMVEAILKGKKAEKPPHMPGYEAKGMTAEQAKSFVAYMKKLKTGS